MILKTTTAAWKEWVYAEMIRVKSRILLSQMIHLDQLQILKNQVKTVIRYKLSSAEVKQTCRKLNVSKSWIISRRTQDLHKPIECTDSFIGNKSRLKEEEKGREHMIKQWNNCCCWNLELPEAWKMLILKLIIILTVKPIKEMKCNSQQSRHRKRTFCYQALCLFSINNFQKEK